MARGRYEEKQKRFLRLFDEVETDPMVEINESLPDDTVETIDIVTELEQQLNYNTQYF